MRSAVTPVQPISLVGAAAEAIRSAEVESREEQRDPGYDDWFDEPAPLTETESGANRAVYDDASEEVWVLPEEEDSHPRGRREISLGGRTLTTAQAAIIAASVLALFFAILAAFGVFNGKKAAAPPVTTPPPPRTVTVTTPATTPSTPTTEAPSQPLSPGDTGPQVKILQQALTALNFSPGKADGVYGPSTQTAVEKFQAANNLDPDGVVGQQTLAALQQALSG
jgi:sulfite reductase alpha subunit-like flavoprotein